ncbi:MAG: hypothetical protein PF689_00915 [Deltaproteobacteria bacterium]|jgi:hypothetical protein|nr:hypothetical protein [Deltaproteobacteria bacterium]
MSSKLYTIIASCFLLTGCPSKNHRNTNTSDDYYATREDAPPRDEYASQEDNYQEVAPDNYTKDSPARRLELNNPALYGSDKSDIIADNPPPKTHHHSRKRKYTKKQRAHIFLKSCLLTHSYYKKCKPGFSDKFPAKKYAIGCTKLIMQGNKKFIRAHICSIRSKGNCRQIQQCARTYTSSR